MAPWPESFPSGSLLSESSRHLTLAFLGEIESSQVFSHLSTFPKPTFTMGLAGYFDRPLFLPPQSPRVAAWHIRCYEEKGLLKCFQEEIVQWLKEKGMTPKEKNREFLPHVTLARSPFLVSEWKQAFEKLPLFLGDVHLYESLGHSQYKVLWSHSILPPFEEFEHTADIAFLIRGRDFSELHLHAQLALSFHCPSLLNYFTFEPIESLEEIVVSLNRMIALLDQDIGSPFKAISYHGSIKEKHNLEWEMIVDV